jgi:hypothetical protein
MGNCFCEICGICGWLFMVSQRMFDVFIDQIEADYYNCSSLTQVSAFSRLLVRSVLALQDRAHSFLETFAHKLSMSC